MLTRGYDWQGKVCEGATPVFMPLNIKTMGVCLPACPTTYDPDNIYCIGNVAPTEANINVRMCVYGGYWSFAGCWSFGLVERLRFVKTTTG